jgi:hypothetical protein
VPKDIESRLANAFVVVGHHYLLRAFHGRSAQRQSEREGGPLIRLAVRPDPPAVPLDDPLNDRQAYAGAFEVARVMQPLENAEQLVDVPHVEAGAVVPHDDHGFAVYFAATHFDDCRVTLEAEQILDQPVHPGSTVDHTVEQLPASSAVCGRTIGRAKCSCG